MELLRKIFDAGVVGAGGAGFPAHIKLNCKVEYLLINAAECEPLLNTDKHIIKSYSDQIVKAAVLVGGLVSAREIHIGVKAVNTAEISVLQGAIDRNNAPCKIFPLDNYYPAGDEQMLVYDITGRTVPPGQIPLAVGCVVSNVATILNIWDASEGRPVTHKFVTVTGEVERPAVLCVPIGTPFHACLYACGGSKLSSYKIINGGPMMGKVFDHSQLDTLFVTKTTSGIIIIPDTGNFVARLHDLRMPQILNRAKSACIQCQFCTELCPRNLIGHKLRPNKIMRYMSMLDLNDEKALDTENEVLNEALICCECGVCETFACPMGLSPRQVNVYIKRRLNKRYSGNQTELVPAKTREHKKITPKKIMMRMGLSDMYLRKAVDFIELSPDVVTIPLRQHIGAPAKACVAIGDYVERGQLIGAGDFEKVSANIHASISGRIVEISDMIKINGGMN